MSHSTPSPWSTQQLIHSSQHQSDAYSGDRHAPSPSKDQWSTKAFLTLGKHLAHSIW